MIDYKITSHTIPTIRTIKCLCGLLTRMDAQEVIGHSEKESDSIKNSIRSVADWFHSNEGEVFEKDDVLDELIDMSNINPPAHMTKGGFCNSLVNSLVGDHVDPVQHISDGQKQYVGVIEYNEHNGYYTFTEYHDISGEHTRAVCANCVQESSRSSEPFTRHTGQFGNEPYGNVEKLHNIISKHIDDEHIEVESVETGATLASGTTIAGNTSIHQGNLDTSFTFTATQNFNGGITANGDSLVDRSSLLTSNTTIDIFDIALVDASAGAVTVTLPPPSTDINASVKKIDSSTNNVDIVTPNAETIDGKSSISISSQYISRTIASDGTNYFII